MNVDVENHAPASPELVPLEVEPPEGPPGKDKIAWLIALDPSTQALVTAACGLAFILLANAQFVGLGVYFVALVPGFVQCKRAFHVYSDSVTKESFTRSALAGFYYTLLVCAAELLALFVLELVTMLTLGRQASLPMISSSIPRMRRLSAIAAGRPHAQMMLRKPPQRWMTRIAPQFAPHALVTWMPMGGW